jgi:hypothetical protein
LAGLRDLPIPARISRTRPSGSRAMAELRLAFA